MNFNDAGKLLALFGAAVLANACSGSSSNDQDQAGAAANAADHYIPAATFQDVMDSVVDPAADYIWEAVSFVSDETGAHENRPRTDAEWHELRRRAVILTEASNLIGVPGRRVANGDETLEEPAPLAVDEIQLRLDGQHEQLVGFADAMRSVALQLVDAADRKDADAVMDYGSALDEACESCHLVFWYPESAEDYRQDQ